MVSCERAVGAGVGLVIEDMHRAVAHLQEVDMAGDGLVGRRILGQKPDAVVALKCCDVRAREPDTVSGFLVRVPLRTSLTLPQCGQRSGRLAVCETRAGAGGRRARVCGIMTGRSRPTRRQTLSQSVANSAGRSPDTKAR